MAAPPQGGFYCHLCGKSFDSNRGLMYHIGSCAALPGNHEFAHSGDTRADDDVSSNEELVDLGNAPTAEETKTLSIDSPDNGQDEYNHDNKGDDNSEGASALTADEDIIENINGVISTNVRFHAHA